MAKKDTQSKSTQSYSFPPVVAVLGHVDHGKTTLLDAFRKTNVAEHEHGGITQKIGATSVEVTTDSGKRTITFIDTPGHEAFSKMRGRGAQAADIGLLIVSVVDGVMPQTKESIDLLKESGIPFIVVLTKSDSPQKNTEKAKQQLVHEEVMLEGMGGDVPVIEVSAKTGSNIKELLDLILLVLDVEQERFASRSKTSPLQAIVIESKLDTKIGPKATVVVKDGSLSVKDELVYEGGSGKVRTIINDKGQHVQSATVGDAVELLGFEKVPEVGSVIQKKSSAKPIETVEEELASTAFTQGNQRRTEAIAQEIPVEFFAGENKGGLSVIFCADTQGSLEAITYSLPKDVKILLAKTGEITTADVLLGKSARALVLGFNVKIRPDVAKLALQEKVLVKNYTVIYEMIDEIKDVLAGKKEALVEQIYGTAKILASFPFEKTKVLGIKVMDGRVARGDKARIVRGEETVGESSITSVRQGKEQTSKIEKGMEGGIILSPFLDFTIGDMVICHG